MITEQDNGRPDPEDFASILRRFGSETAEAKRYGSMLLALPPSSWRRTIRSDRRFRTRATLSFLLEAAHARLEKEPTLARELTSAVLASVDRVAGGWRVQVTALRGLAWKEHANALRVTDDLRAAIKAIEHALAIFADEPSLDYQAATAKLVKAQILREMGEDDAAVALARECAVKFRDYGDSRYLVMARITEGWILYNSKQYGRAMAIFADLTEEAERTGDRATLARALQNTAACARELGDTAAARDLYARALPLFVGLQLVTEIPRVQWGYALSLVADGRFHDGVSELYKTRALYLDLGMNVEAATAALDIVRAKFLNGDDVTSLCGELVTTLVSAGMTQNAIEALAYLREQARHGAVDIPKITRVREFLSELGTRPTLGFVRPEDG